MRTGVSYMSHHNPKHIKSDLVEMVALKLDDLFVCLQENDFTHFTGKVHFSAQLAHDVGIRPLAIFWGAMNFFGGGRSSQFLLEHPDCFQVARDGSHRAAGCYINPTVIDRIQEMIDITADAGYEGYFVDEPTPLRHCFCPSCCARFDHWYHADLMEAEDRLQEEFRQRCVIDYVTTIADYCKSTHPALETICCLMPVDQAMWQAAGQIASLDNIGTDVYWANNDRDLAEMTQLVNELDTIAKNQGKVHHEWLECWRVQSGNEERVLEMGKTLVRTRPDALYVWAWEGQVGTAESCANPALAWSKAVEVLRLAKAGLPTATPPVRP